MPNQMPPVLSARNVSKRYFRRQAYTGQKTSFEALKSVSLTLEPGSMMAIIGESGSGKSTLARCLAGLERPNEGEIQFGDVEINALNSERLRTLRPKIQLVLQDSATALNPRYTVEWLIEEPLNIQRWGTSADRQARVQELMKEVGLDADSAERTSLEMSGGQRQRIALARALALKPEVLILDESLSALDLSTQASMVRLIKKLQERYRFSCLSISHDLRLISQMAGRVAVMYRGEIVESGSCTEIIARPQHPHTAGLVEAVRELQSACVAVTGR